MDTLIKIGGMLAVGAAVAAAPIIPSELTFVKAYQYEASAYKDVLVPATVSTSSKTKGMVIPAVKNPQPSFEDDDGNGIVSVAVYTDKNGKLVFARIPDATYSRMGQRGGHDHNPKKTEQISVLELVAKQTDAAAAIATSTDGIYTTSASSVTTPVTMSGSNTLLYTHVWAGNSISTPTYNGTTMTVLSSYTDDGGHRFAHFYLVAPTTGTNNLVVSLGGTTYSTVLNLGLSGIDQTNPINASSTDGFAYDWTDRGATLVTTVDGCAVFTVAVLDNRSVVAGDANSTFVHGVIYPGYNYITGLARSTTFPQTAAGSILVTLDGASYSWGRAFSIAFAPATAAAGSSSNGPQLMWFE